MTGMACSPSRDSVDIRVVRIILDDVLVDNVWVLLDTHLSIILYLLVCRHTILVCRHARQGCP